MRWLVGRIGDLAPSPGYRPRLHFDLYGCAGLAFKRRRRRRHRPDAGIDAVAGYLAELGQLARPYDLAIEHPIDAGSREAQIATYRALRAALRARGSNVRIVVDEWCNTLDDVRAFVAAGAADVIHVKTPDLGSIGNTVRRCCWPATPGWRPSAAAPATRPTGRPRSARTWRWPARPPRCWPSRAWAWTRD